MCTLERIIGNFKHTKSGWWGCRANITNKNVHKNQSNSNPPLCCFYVSIAFLFWARGKRCEFPEASLPFFWGSSEQAVPAGLLCPCSPALAWALAMSLTPTLPCSDTAQWQCCLCCGAPSSDSFLRHTCFSASHEQALSWHAYIRELNRTRAHNEHWHHWVVQSVQFLAWCTTQFHWLKLLCDCRHHLVMCMNHGLFPSAYLEGLILGRKRMLTMHGNPCTTYCPWGQREVPSLFFFPNIFIVSFAH